MNDVLDFPTTPEYPKEMILRVQRRLLEMADVTSSILDRNRVKYFITFGTLLGSVRHGGFIPWDDDFDLMLFDDEYERALECLRNELPPDMIVHDRETDPIYWPGWSRIRDIHSTTIAKLWPDDNAYKYTGINLDLYRVKVVKRGDVELYRKKEHIEFIVRKHTSGILDDSSYENKFNLWTAEYAELLKSRIHDSHSEEDVVAFVTPDFVSQEMSSIFPLRKYRFEGQEYWGPNDSDVVLRHMFGDYMEIPAYEKRRAHYDSVAIC